MHVNTTVIKERHSNLAILKLLKLLKIDMLLKIRQVLNFDP